MSGASVLAGARFVEATRDHDEAIVALAERNNLRVDPSAQRGQATAQLLVALNARDEVIGFVSARFLLEEAEIFDLCVEETWRRRGIGHALLKWLFERLQSQGVREVLLEVRANNQGAQTLYRSAGFSAVGTRARYYADGEDATIFRCCLPPTL